METVKFRIIERRWSGNVLARDVTDAKGKVKTTMMMVAFNKEFDPLLTNMCSRLNMSMRSANEPLETQIP